MKKSITIVGSLLMSLFSCLYAQTQCLGPEYESIIEEGFEDGIPADWTAEATTDGGSWQVNDAKIGYYENPGSGKWAYVNDEAEDNVGRAVLLSPLLDLSSFRSHVDLSFDLNFQEFGQKGVFLLELYDGTNWQILYECREDMAARLEVDISDFCLPGIQIRFTYDDEGEWGWGMGLDNIMIQGYRDLCGNGLCDQGESPESCPGDCPLLQNPAAEWTPEGQDLYGQSVNFISFKAGTPCDDCSEEIDLGFEFDFFGEKYERVFLNSNGNLTFGAEFLSFTPQAFCLNGPKMIAPFFSDVDLSDGGSISYYRDPEGHYFMVLWKSVAFFGCEGAECNQRNTYQVVLTDGTVRQLGETILPLGTTVGFVYGDMQWTTGSSSGGIGGFGGAPATVGMNYGDGQLCHDYGLFNQEGHAYYGSSTNQSCMINAVSHLDHRLISLSGEKGEVLEYGNLMIKGELAQLGNTISWCTDQVTETEYFVLERQSETGLFEELSTIYPNGPEELKPGEFQFLDEQTYVDTTFYRIVQVKTDGTLNHSPVIWVEGQGEQSGTNVAAGNIFQILQVGPNPFRHHLNIRYEVPASGQVEYQLIDISGRVHLQNRTQSYQGVNELNLELPDLAPAIYFLNMFQGDNKANFRLIRE